MKDLLLHIKDLPLDGYQNKEKLAATIERLYFIYIRPWNKSLRSSEPFRIASDLVRLEEAIEEKGSIQELRPKSRLLITHPLIAQMRLHTKLEAYKIDQIRDQIIEPNRFYIPAVMTAEIINGENRKERWRWFSTLVLGLITAILAIIAKQLGALL